jgi:hypothetical protein
MMPTMAPGGTLKLRVVDQQAVAEGLADAVELDDLVAEALAGRDEDFLGLVALLVFDADISSKRARRALLLAWRALGLLRTHSSSCFIAFMWRVSCFFRLQAASFCSSQARVVALPRDAVAAVEFEDPLGGVVEEVAVVGDGDHGAGEAQQELFQPFDRFGVEVVGRLVQQQHVGLGQQQLAQRDAALLAAGELADLGVPGRQAQRVGGDFQLGLGVGAGGGDDGFQPRLFLGQLVEVGAFLGVGGVHGFQLGLGFHDLAHAGFDFLAHGLGRVELRFLRQVADAHAGRCCTSPSNSLSRRP